VRPTPSTTTVNHGVVIRTLTCSLSDFDIVFPLYPMNVIAGEGPASDGEGSLKFLIHAVRDRGVSGIEGQGDRRRKKNRGCLSELGVVSGTEGKGELKKSRVASLNEVTMNITGLLLPLADIDWTTVLAILAAAAALLKALTALLTEFRRWWSKPRKNRPQGG
jgi:hypothetical protein